MADLADYAQAFDANELLASEAEVVVRDVVAVTDLANTIKVLAARRVADSASWKHRGHRTAAEWLAAQSKCDVGEAIRRQLETAEKLSDCPQVEAKARAGELPEAQTQALAKAVSSVPSAESRLLSVAEADGLNKLRDECRALANPGENAEVRHARLQSRALAPALDRR